MASSDPAKVTFDDYGFPVYKRIKVDETKTEESTVNAAEVAGWITTSFFLLLYVFLACVAGYLSHYDFIHMSTIPRFFSRLFAILFNFVYLGWKIFRHYFGDIFSKLKAQSVQRYAFGPNVAPPTGMVYPPA